MNALAWLGVVLGVIGVGLAIASLSRAIPVLRVDPGPSSFWTISHSGPRDLVVVEAYVFNVDRKRIPLGHHVPEVERDEMAVSGMLMGEPGNPWMKRRILLAHSQYLVEQVSVSDDLLIKYRVKGLLGFLSRHSLRISGGP